MRFHTLIILSTLLAAHTVWAALQVDLPYADHMVLQRGRPVPVSGTCSGLGDVVVQYGAYTARAQARGGVWQAVLEPMPYSAEGKPLIIRQGEEELRLEDVVVGEVWLAAGQSNMLLRLEETGDAAALRHEEMPGFRFYHAEPQVHTDAREYGQALRERLVRGEMFSGSWRVSSPSSAARMSAVGWYFGKRLHEALGVPVGVIHVSLGGSEMMAWLPPALLEKAYSEHVTPQSWLESKYISPWVRGRGRLNLGSATDVPHPFMPGYLFRTGIAPWLNFPIAGVIWYQGESDAETPDEAQNRRLLEDLIVGWRSEFKSARLPFVMVQLPRINDRTPLRAYWPEFREVQARVAEALPQVAYVTTIDLGSQNADVHPKRKVEVGERLAAVAASEFYGAGKGAVHGPGLARAVRHGEGAIITYRDAEGLHTLDGKPPVGFELSENGQDYFSADAELRDGSVWLACAQVKNPQYVRYAWAVYLEPNLTNGAGLPARPFRARLEQP